MYVNLQEQHSQMESGVHSVCLTEYALTQQGSYRVRVSRGCLCGVGGCTFLGEAANALLALNVPEAERFIVGA